MGGLFPCNINTFPYKEGICSICVCMDPRVVGDSVIPFTIKLLSRNRFPRIVVLPLTSKLAFTVTFPRIFPKILFLIVVFPVITTLPLKVVVLVEIL